MVKNWFNKSVNAWNGVNSIPLVSGMALLVFLGCSSSPSTIDEYIEAGDRHMRSGNLNQAISSYRLAFHQDTLNAVVLARLAKVYQAQGNSSAADTYARRAANSSYQQGLAALQAGDDSTAMAAFQQTIEIIPSHPPALNRLGEISLARNDPDQALAYFEQSAQVNPRFAETFLKLGQIHLARGNRQAARDAFQQAVELNINASKGYLGLGEISLQERKWAEAIEHFEKALLIRPHSQAAREGLYEARSNL